MLDRKQRIVRLSREFPERELLYTASHELAHVVLDHQGETIHRDRPMDPSTWHKDPQEREADYFAACFRMPQKWVRHYFEEIFLTQHFVLTEATAFALFQTSPDVAAAHIRSERDLSLPLARAISYGRPVRSLIEIFGVTASAMARRLEELRLLTPPVRG
jgi:Zn-dependent peptidase ImmA (M78 family)